MNGYQCYRYYMSVKMHFTQKKFNVFVNPNVRISFETFSARNDRTIFEKLAKKFDTTQPLIQYFVANLSIGHNNFIYDYEVADQNYLQWKAYKEARSYRFKSDLQKINYYSETNKIDFDHATWKCYLNKQISIQTIHICDEIDNILSRVEEANGILFEDDLLRIKKLKGFIKIDDIYKNIYEKEQKSW